ncbi:MAG TPA: HAMP domain-containing sensor histidine kinase [Ignavibacteriales bacterium]|nr:HAMP domain-containing sensor histidine kinase [Ignavibacteriales bacterium]HOL81940.1 HAMP domain-containing sensor histidine kinase [Ignavibacteriales bacterium]HOM65936.1 HAMP domain-containing sensor histidine kinase [Ignavibacteriales bacterium]HPD67468.1 HAMP domain-containing sensor histidine kinase [Ignavibacteriales bacterium]HPP34077.1 HAMP domain-containing sensor histidine kinase [Ignavibacteriales bacterium]
MKKWFSYYNPFNFKIVLSVIALGIAYYLYYYTDELIQNLQNREYKSAQLYANALEYITTSGATNQSEFTFIFENIIQKIDFPIIYTDKSDNIDIKNLQYSVKNIIIDSNLSEKEKMIYLKEIMSDMDNLHQPIEIKYNDIIIGKLHYGDSFLIKKLKIYPYLQFMFMGFFMIIFYLLFNYMKLKEQSNIWIGLAKETAHQLGTPLSSLMGWNEYLKLNYNKPEKVLDVTTEIDRDIERFNKITQRFSKIGSKPELQETNIVNILHNIVNYFTIRLPQKGQKVVISVNAPNMILAYVNPNLFEWVIENLIKNSLDAIGSNKGVITIDVEDNIDHYIIDITDTGKGIEPKKKKTIFRPGYTTKKRGWGLGLTLSKRIIEEYHKGKIFVKSTFVNQGTTMRIIMYKKIKPKNSFNLLEIFNKFKN